MEVSGISSFDATVGTALTVLVDVANAMLGIKVMTIATAKIQANAFLNFIFNSSFEKIL